MMTGRLSTPADGFLHLLNAEPSLLSPAPANYTARDMDRRASGDEGPHPCLRCGETARTAYVADTEIGPRWLDLCWPCTTWLRLGMTDHSVPGTAKGEEYL